MQPVRLSLFAAATVLLPLGGLAQEFSVRPGLWEHQIDIKSASGRIELALEMARTQMALLPPEQRQSLESVIRSQGLKVDWLNQRFQNCITEQEATSGQFRFAEEGGCRYTNVEQRGLATHIDFVCDQGQGSVMLADGMEYTGESSMTLNFNGIIEHATATHSGRWLGASCDALGQ